MRTNISAERHYISNKMIVAIVLLIIILMIEAYLIFVPSNIGTSSQGSQLPKEQANMINLKNSFID